MAGPFEAISELSIFDHCDSKTCKNAKGFPGVTLTYADSAHF